MIRFTFAAFFVFTALVGINSAQSVPADPEHRRVGHFTCDLDIAFSANDASASVFLAESRGSATADEPSATISSGTTRSIDEMEAESSGGSSLGRSIASKALNKVYAKKAQLKEKFADRSELRDRKAQDERDARDDRRTPGDQHFANLIGRGIASCKNETGFQFNLPTVMSIALNSSEKIPLQDLRATVHPVSVSSDVNRIFDQYRPHIEVSSTPGRNVLSGSERSLVVRGGKHDVLLQVNLTIPAALSQKVRIARVDLKFDNEAPNLD